MAALTITRGTVAKTNSTGLQTAEDPGRWINLSKFSQPAPIIPPVGTVVELALDGSGFIREIRALGTNAAPGASGSTERRAPVTDTQTVRLACLTAAATFLAPRAEAKREHLLELAELMETWATR